jgi:hypothetical protein
LKIDVYHICYDELHALSKLDLNSSESIKLLANTQEKKNIIIDDELREKAMLVKDAFLTLIDKRRHSDYNSPNDVRKALGKSAVSLLAGGWYELVATMYDKNLLETLKLTTNINSYWIFGEDVKVIKPTLRSTMTLDVFSVDTTPYLYTTGGFINMKNGTMLAC